MEHKAVVDSEGREWKQVRFAPRLLFNLSVLALPLHGSIRLRRQATFTARLCDYATSRLFVAWTRFVPRVCIATAN